MKIMFVERKPDPKRIVFKGCDAVPRVGEHITIVGHAQGEPDEDEYTITGYVHDVSWIFEGNKHEPGTYVREAHVVVREP
jgi:hypothetical protein